MKKLRAFLDNLEPLFIQGGRFERFHALFEAVDTFLFSPPDLSRGAPHVRDALDLKRVMITVVIAATPAALAGMWNTGYQANMAMEGLGLAGLEGWRGALLPISARVTFEILEPDKRPVSAVADFTEVRDVLSVEVVEDRTRAVEVLYDPEHNLEDRILSEQFTA